MQLDHLNVLAAFLAVAEERPPPFDLNATSTEGYLLRVPG